ncbi:hypothetical protein MACK_003534 [Theileria orientalis]|uniref:ABC transporter n=1 Tax=Theileria orientalis TaxID=68886 RepID=A0A976SJ94_THEOR|nr:hypothetical protein MACK_003534 [Theileria orientalis]
MVSKDKRVRGFETESSKLLCSTNEYSDYTFDRDLHMFWESRLYNKSFFKNWNQEKKFKYHDDITIFKFLFMSWVYKWAKYISKGYIEPYKLHPLPVSDQILYWQPIFSKHVSDGLIRLELFKTLETSSKELDRRPAAYRKILIRAIFLTFWKRTLFGLVGVIVTNIMSMSIALLVKKLLKILSEDVIDLTKTILYVLAFVLFNLIDGLVSENFVFYLYRLIHMIQYSVSITVFQLGICHRRSFFDDIDGSNNIAVCREVLHSCSPDSNCYKNPLFCPSLRYQNRDIGPKIFSFEFIDSYYISLFFESMLYIVNFLSRFIYGIVLMSRQVRVSMWVLYVVGIVCVVMMTSVEVLNTYVLNLIYLLKDFRISKCIEIISGLPIINKMLCDDIAMNIVTECRNNELILFLTRIFLTLLSKSMYIVFTNISFYILKRGFVKSVNNASIITDVDTAGFMSTFYIFFKIMDSMNILPHSIKRITTSYTSFGRVRRFAKRCSPNFYITDNKYTGSVKTSTNVVQVTDQVPNDAVVYYNDASFAWVASSKDLLDYNYEPSLNNVNFQLKRGEIAIITGAQGSGKSNFIKSMLGEMTLVGGSMAVIPLHTSMPIFYASQDIWLHQGTIRSNITFGYRFDENLYNIVLKAVELQSDISTWEKGDLRVVSDNAHTLSGGQRVRMEMARAIYAYLIFHQVNTDYNNGKCSFLMCLDSPFHGLDPFVSKTVFNNLFNIKTGVLIKDDLSVVLSSTIRYLNTCLEVSHLNQAPNPPIYRIKNDSLKFFCYLHDYINNNVQTTEDFKYLSTNTGPYQLNYLTRDMLSLCSSGSTTRLGRKEVTRTKYDKSFKSFVRDELSGVKFNPYFVYMRPALSLFIIFIIITVVYTVMDNAKFILSTDLSDYIKKSIDTFNSGSFVDFEKVKSRCNTSLFIIFVITTIIVVLTITTTILFSASCIVSSRKIHEYCINSIFKNSSSVIKIKKQVSQIITYLSCDIFQIDEGFGYAISSSLMLLIETMIGIMTLCYIMPLSIPFVSVSLVIIYKCVFSKYINSSRNLQMGSLESMSHINAICENGITGSCMYRGFKKEAEFMDSLIEHTDYYMRCRFLHKAIVTWSTIMSNWIFSTTLLFLIIPIFCNKYTKYKIGVGHFALGLSVSINIVKTFTSYSMSIARLEIYMCSIQRFQYFIPPGQKLKFGKSMNCHEEFVLNPGNKGYAEVYKKHLLKRRQAEFKADDRRFQALRRFFFNPKINVLNVDRYVAPEHSGIELKDVCVYTTPDHNAEGMILKNITVSAHRSDIVGIIGRTGSGKTTLLSVLENSMRNRTGQVILDGMDLNNIPKVVLGQILGVLPQLPFVFKGWTIRRFLDPRKLFSDEEINQALDLCGLLDFVNDLQGGKKLDTIILPEDVSISKTKSKTKKKQNHYPSKSFKSERSLTMECLRNYYINSDMALSNTQLRTLAFTRLVLYRQFYRIILVDEPPSENAFDQPNVQDVEIGIPIYELLQKYFRHCTTFVTAHDDNALAMCSLIWVVHKGSLVTSYKKENIDVSLTIERIIQHSVGTDEI